MRLKSVILGAVLFIASSLGNVYAADQYKFDKSHSYIGFGVKHMVLSTTKGSFQDFSGIIHFDSKKIKKSSVDVTIKVASINTENEKRDAHLRNSDFFDAVKFPDMTFKSKKVSKTKDGYEMIGLLTIRDVTKEIRFPFNLVGPIKDPWGNDKIGIEANLVINRQDYGISWNKTMDKGGLVVGNDVKIELSLEAGKAK